MRILFVFLFFSQLSLSMEWNVEIQAPGAKLKKLSMFSLKSSDTMLLPLEKKDWECLAQISSQNKKIKGILYATDVTSIICSKSLKGGNPILSLSALCSKNKKTGKLSAYIPADFRLGDASENGKTTSIKVSCK